MAYRFSTRSKQFSCYPMPSLRGLNREDSFKKTSVILVSQLDEYSLGTGN